MNLNLKETSKTKEVEEKNIFLKDIETNMKGGNSNDHIDHCGKSQAR